MDSLQQTREFMLASGRVIPAVPTLPSHDLAQFRLGLLHEELSELEEALLAGNKVEILDALADLRVVLDGAVLAFGMQNVYQPALDEVHRSNMSKFCIDGMEVEETIYQYQQQGIEATSMVTATWDCGTPRRWAIHRATDGKTLKSIHYSPANLAPLLP